MANSYNKSKPMPGSMEQKIKSRHSSRGITTEVPLGDVPVRLAFGVIVAMITKYITYLYEQNADILLQFIEHIGIIDTILLKSHFTATIPARKSNRSISSKKCCSDKGHLLS